MGLRPGLPVACSILPQIEPVNQHPFFIKLIKVELPFATQSLDSHCTECDFFFSGGIRGGREGTQLRLKTWMKRMWAPAMLHLSRAHLSRGILKFSHSISL